MKRQLVALAVLATLGAAAHAQSSVTLFGVADAVVQIGRGSESNQTGLGSGGLASSRFGVRGVEDLGGGLKAGFWLEAGYNLDSGNASSNRNGGNNNQFGSVASDTGLRFGRRATVSLMGDNWGEFRLGRDFSLQYLNSSAFDPFGDNGVGATLLTNTTLGLSGPVATRVDNSLTYFTPNFGGFYGALQAYRGEQAAGAGRDNGNGYGVRLGYKAGPLDIGVSYGSTDYASGTTAATAIQGDIDDWSVGASYNLGVATIMAAYRRAEVDNAAFGDPEGQGYIVGARVPLGAGEIRTSWSRYEREYAGVDAKADKFAVGYVHNLSKRTALYTTFAYLKNKGGAGVTLNGATLANGSDSSKGLDIGLRHAF